MPEHWKRWPLGPGHKGAEGLKRAVCRTKKPMANGGTKGKGRPGCEERDSAKNTMVRGLLGMGECYYLSCVICLTLCPSIFYVLCLSSYRWDPR